MNLRRIESLAPDMLSEDGFLNGCVETVRSIVSGMNGEIMTHASAYGDFTPFNLFVEKQRTVGFDFGVHRRAPVASDISRFLIYLDIYHLIPTRRGELRESGCRERHVRAFMGGYGSEEKLLAGGGWLKFQFMEVVRRMVSLMAMRAKGRNHAFRAVEMMLLRRSARQIMGGLTVTRDPEAR